MLGKKKVFFLNTRSIKALRVIWAHVDTANGRRSVCVCVNMCKKADSSKKIDFLLFTPISFIQQNGYVIHPPAMQHPSIY